MLQVLFSLCATIVGFFILPESLPKNKRETIKLVRKDLNPLSSIGKFITKPILGIFLMVFIIYNFTFSGFTISLPIFLIHKFNIDPLNVAGILFVSGIVSSIVQGGLIGRLDIKFGDKNLLMMGLIIFSIGLIFFFMVPIFLDDIPYNWFYKPRIRSHNTHLEFNNIKNSIKKSDRRNIWCQHFFK